MKGLLWGLWALAVAWLLSLPLPRLLPPTAPHWRPGRGWRAKACRCSDCRSHFAAVRRAAILDPSRA